MKCSRDASAANAQRSRKGDNDGLEEPILAAKSIDKDDEEKVEFIYSQVKQSMVEDEKKLDSNPHVARMDLPIATEMKDETHSAAVAQPNINTTEP